MTYFIGPTIHKCINLGGNPEWETIWKNILNVYAECVDDRANKSLFYWTLTTCLGKILLTEKLTYVDIPKNLSRSLKTISDKHLALVTIIEDSLHYNFTRLVLSFINLAIIAMEDTYSTIYDRTFIHKTIDDITVTCKKKFDQIVPLIYFESSYDGEKILKDELTKLQGELYDRIEDMFRTVYTSVYNNKYNDANATRNKDMKLLPDNIIKTWNNIGPIYWLWFHLTSAKFENVGDTVSSSSLKEFFDNIDIFISCAVCRDHFRTMRETDIYQQLKGTLPTDLFLMEVHQIVRKTHYRNDEGNMRYVDAAVVDDEQFIYKVREEYRTWWLH